MCFFVLQFLQNLTVISVSESLYNKNRIKLKKEKLSYTIAPELVRKQTVCHFLKSTTIRHTWSALRLGGACHATDFGISDRIIMCLIGW